MKNFAIHMENLPRMNRLAPPLLFLGTEQSPATERPWVRTSFNFGLFLEAGFPEVCFLRDGKSFSVPVPACVCTLPGPLYRQNNPASARKLILQYDPGVMGEFPWFTAVAERVLIPIPQSSTVRMLLDRLTALSADAYTPGNADRIDLTAASLLLEIAAGTERANDEADAAVRAVRAIASRLDAHWAEPADWDELAREYGLSPRGFQRAWRRVFGRPPGGYLRGKRLEEARRMLLSTELSVREIARRCGFPDPFYFTRAFHREAGDTPSGFRARYSSALRGAAGH